MAIAYVEHPLTKADKAKYLKDFKKVLDVRFKPVELNEGDKVFTKAKPVKATKPKEIEKTVKAEK